MCELEVFRRIGRARTRGPQGSGSVLVRNRSVKARRVVRSSAPIRGDNAGMSNEKAGAMPADRKRITSVPMGLMNGIVDP